MYENENENSNENDDGCTEVEKKTEKRGFAKIDVVDVILSAEGQQALTKSNNALEQLTEITFSMVHFTIHN